MMPHLIMVEQEIVVVACCSAESLVTEEDDVEGVQDAQDAKADDEQKQVDQHIAVAPTNVQEHTDRLQPKRSIITKNHWASKLIAENLMVTNLITRNHSVSTVALDKSHLATSVI